MRTVTIDSGVLALPGIGAREAEIIEFVQQLLDWSALVDEGVAPVFVSARTPELLFENNLYTYNGVRELLVGSGIQQYDARTVNKVVLTLLESTPTFERAFGIEDVLLSDFRSEPSIDCLEVHPRLAEDLRRLLMLIAMLSCHCRDENIQHGLVIRRLTGYTVIQVTAAVHDIESDRMDWLPAPEPPALVPGRVEACGDASGFLMQFDELRAWKAATSAVEIRAAIRIALFKSRVLRGESCRWATLPPFEFGKDFVESAVQCSRGQPVGFGERTLRAIVETIDGLNPGDTHPLRTDRGGNSPQVIRGRDRAWRRDIDREFHLHYWQCAGWIELAAVVAHNEFRIPG